MSGLCKIDICPVHRDGSIHGCQPCEWAECKQGISAAPAVRLESSWKAAGEQLAMPGSSRGAAEAERSANICPAEVISGCIFILLAGYEKRS